MAYYPLNKIIVNLFTSGNEFRYKQTGGDYKGYYFSTYDGKFFTEKEPINSSVELIRYTNSKTTAPTLSSTMYVSATGTTPASYDTSHYTPNPTDADYAKGYITRYFIKRVNGDSSTIRELSPLNYSEVQKDPLYNTLSLTWKISGNLKDTPFDNSMPIPGVISVNSKTIHIAENNMTGISTYLPDPTQLHK